MTKARLCNRDEWELQEALEAFRDKLHDIGISKMSYAAIHPNGNISASLRFNDSSTLNMDIHDDGDFISRRYIYDDSTR